MKRMLSTYSSSQVSGLGGGVCCHISGVLCEGHLSAGEGIEKSQLLMVSV